jgi:hypothetical protein
MNAWLGVASAQHVRRGVGLGIGQANHGARPPLARMKPGDWLVYYSPRELMGEGPPLQAFTAIGRIADAEIWQADEGSFHPFRRDVDYFADAEVAPIAPLQPLLELCSGPNWGYQLRRGMLPLSEADLQVIRGAMGVPA